MCEPRKNVECQDTLVEIGLLVLFLVLATLTSLLVAPRLI